MKQESNEPAFSGQSADLSRLDMLETSDNLPDRLASTISQAIITGAFRPGDRLHPDDIARHFDISKIPVREALRTVEADGWIRSRPRRGTFVASPTMQELLQVFETRMMLEPGLARLAAQRRTAAQVKLLERIMERTRRALIIEDTRKIADANSEFHALVADCAANTFAKEIMRRVELRIRWYFTNVPLGRSRNTIEEHSAIFQAIRDGDAGRAEQATLHHLTSTFRTATAGTTFSSEHEGA